MQARDSGEGGEAKNGWRDGWRNEGILKPAETSQTH